MRAKSFAVVVPLMIYVLYCIATAQLQQIDFPLGGLPYDEHSALLELSEGRLDSALWEKVKPFYEEPLSVPLGELRDLRETFPELPVDIPSTPEALARYEPWTTTKIELFFKEYPYLLAFKPLMRFEINQMPVMGHCTFSMRRSGYSEAFNQSLHFVVSPGSVLRAEGNVAIGDSYSRWQRRRIVLNFPKGSTIQLGNVGFSINSGLFYGYFPLLSNSYEKSTANWLYGTSRTWNGIAAKTPIGDKCSLTMLVHTREIESIAAIKTQVLFSQRIKLYAAVSGAVSDDGPEKRDTLVGVHSGITTTMGPWEMALESGVNLLQARYVPFYYTLSYNHTGNIYEVSCIRIPARFSAPRSSMLHTFLSRLNIEERADRDIYAVLLSSRCPLFVTCEQVIDASYLVSGGNADCRASYSFFGKHPFSYMLYYGLDAKLVTGGMRHRLKGTVECRGRGGNVFFSSIFYEVNQDACWTAGLYCKIDVPLFAVYCLSPLASFTHNANRDEDIAVGIQQRIYFFEKTYGEASITVPVHSMNNEHVSFYAKTHFLF